MTLETARQVLQSAAEDEVRLADAITVVADSPHASIEDFLAALRHPGFVAEQAAFELYARTDRPLPANRSQISTQPGEWRRWLAEHSNDLNSTGA